MSGGLASEAAGDLSPPRSALGAGTRPRPRARRPGLAPLIGRDPSEGPRPLEPRDPTPRLEHASPTARGPTDSFEPGVGLEGDPGEPERVEVSLGGESDAREWAGDRLAQHVPV